MIHWLDGGLSAFIQPEMLSDKVCVAAVAKTGKPLRFVPEKLRSLVIWARAVDSEPAAIAYTPSRLRDEIRKLNRDSG